MAPRSGLPPSARFPWLLGAVAVAFVLGIWLGRTPDEPPAPSPRREVEIRIDESDLTLLPDASLHFDAEPKEIDDFQTTGTPDSQVDNPRRKR
jgi:hypothetical protein